MPDNKLSLEIDENIWLKIETGDESAYEEMYTCYFRRLYLYGQKITEDIPLIEDAIQETMIQIWQNRSGLSTIQSPGGYYYISFRNLLVRKLKVQGTIVSQEYVGEGASLSHDHVIIKKEEHAEKMLQLNKASHHLTERQSEAIFLRFYEGRSYEEVAEIMGITVKATYKIMARALMELKKKYVLPLIIFFSFLRSF